MTVYHLLCALLKLAQDSSKISVDEFIECFAPIKYLSTIIIRMSRPRLALDASLNAFSRSHRLQR